ncbi:MAG: SRPBCC family protein [Alphaproteobacteria bacterium]|nr:SRPBCC family protein [Alphaproteobacteria bacterium]
MTKMMMTLAACLALVTGPALAHGPVRLKTEQTVTLDAPLDDVWGVIGHFDDMSWFPGVASVAATGTEKGATRVRTMEDGQVINEELLKLQPEKYAISTLMLDTNLDVVKATNYASHITLKDADGKTLLTWKGAFYRGFPQNEPPADLNDDAAVASVEALHQTGIDALVERFGKVE